MEEGANEVAVDSPETDVSVADREELTRTMRAISNLPTSLREPLVLHTIQGQSQAETAAALKISEKAVETRLRRARQRLRNDLDLQS